MLLRPSLGTYAMLQLLCSVGQDKRMVDRCKKGGTGLYFGRSTEGMGPL